MDRGITQGDFVPIRGLYLPPPLVLISLGNPVVVCIRSTGQWVPR